MAPPGNGRFVWLLPLLVMAIGCGTKRPQTRPETPPGGRLVAERSWTCRDDGAPTGLETALARTEERLAALPAEEELALGTERLKRKTLLAGIRLLRENVDRVGRPGFSEWLAEHFRLLRVDRPVLVTGYYEPLLHGARQPSERYRYPLYRRPDDLVVIELKDFYFAGQASGMPRRTRGRLTADRRVVPYPDRDAIDHAGALAGRNLELLWVDDPIDLFFLQIQGSGVVELETGETVRVGYAESNGHPYRAIGRLLLDRGWLTREGASMQGIRRCLQARPEAQREVLSRNPSYVFFRETGAAGAIGALGVELVPERGIAVDPRWYPLGGLAWLETRRPEVDSAGEVAGWQTTGRLVVCQDTGGAIVGPLHVDLFTGSGALAELWAGHLKDTGTLILLVPKESEPAPPVSLLGGGENTANGN